LSSDGHLFGGIRDWGLGTSAILNATQALCF
jgi:hypothetical protein